MQTFPQILTTHARDAGLNVIHYEHWNIDNGTPPQHAGVTINGDLTQLCALLLNFDAHAIDPAERDALTESMTVKTSIDGRPRATALFPGWQLDDAT